MAVEEGLFARLSGHPGLSALVGSRIYPVKMPQGGTLPAITYQRISTPRQLDLEGGAFVPARFQVSIWATSYSAAKQVAAQVQAALAAWTDQANGVQSCDMIGEQDLYEDGVEIYHIPQDYHITYAE